MSGAVIAIVGAGLAGFQVASALREQNYAERVVLIGNEPHRPYHRPPLSKAHLLGGFDDAKLDLRPDAYYADKRIELLTNRSAVAIHRAPRKLVLDDASVIEYEHLVLAVGARNRPLAVPGTELDGVCFLRTLDEARDLRARLHTVKRVVVIGAGFIGLEFAATAMKLGVHVTVIEVAERAMSRALSAPMAAMCARQHARTGIQLAFNTQVSRVLGEAGRVTGVQTASGEVIAAELVVIGIGVIPNVELAAASGLEVANGIVVDEELRTRDPHISAVGDCTSHPNPHAAGECVRLESVQNATDQARCVASRILGRPARYTAVPWFWSDQGELKLQIAGLGSAYDQAVVRGDPAGISSTVFCFRSRRLLSIETLNRPADHMAARRLLSRQVTLTPEQAADEHFDLKQLPAAPPLEVAC